MVSLRLPPQVERKLASAARKSGRSKTAFVREAVISHLEDLEDITDAEAVMARLKSGQEAVIPGSMVKRELGL